MKRVILLLLFMIFFLLIEGLIFSKRARTIPIYQFTATYCNKYIFLKKPDLHFLEE